MNNASFHFNNEIVTPLSIDVTMCLLHMPGRLSFSPRELDNAVIGMAKRLMRDVYDALRALRLFLEIYYAELRAGPLFLPAAFYCYWQEVVEVKKEVIFLQAQLQAADSEASSSESQLQQSRQELKTEEDRLEKLRSKVWPWGLFALIGGLQIIDNFAINAQCSFVGGGLFRTHPSVLS